MLSNLNSYEAIPEPHRMTYRIPIIVAALLMSLVYVVTLSAKSNGSSNIPAREQFGLSSNQSRARTTIIKKLLHNECPRVRRDWHDLTQEERDLYFDAYWEMYNRGILAIFYRSHKAKGIHGTPDFLAWHRYFIYEYESRIRALGGRFRCFALPYWDWSRMAGKPIASNPLWRQGFGGNGVLSAADKAAYNKTGKYPYHSTDKVQGGCVLDGRFAKSTGYRTTIGDCLRRQFSSGTYWYQATAQTLELIEECRTYDDFENQFETWHNAAHNGVGGNLKQTPTAPQEPIFFLLHSYVDLIWALRSDCHGYDSMTNWRTNKEIFDLSLLNSKLYYPYIDRYSWSIAHYEQITPARIMNFPQFGIQYDLSDMFQRTKMQLNSCRFTYFNPKPMRKLPPGSVRVPDAVIARRACKKAFAGCEYKTSLIGCASINQTLLTLSIILNRPGVSGNICVQRWRFNNFNLMKAKGNLLALCDGEYDPVCVSA